MILFLIFENAHFVWHLPTQNEAIHIKEFQERWCYSKCQLYWATYLPKLFVCHFVALKLANQSVSIIANETTVITTASWMYCKYLWWVITPVDIAFVTDFAVYCKKVHKKLIKYVSSYHVLCLAHILNLVEVFSHWPAFENISLFTAFIKTFF